METIEEFRKRQKKRILFGMLFIALWLPAIGLSFLDSEPFIITLSLKGIGLIFIFLAVANSKCPACGKHEGGSWRIRACKACGHPNA